MLVKLKFWINALLDVLDIVRYLFINKFFILKTKAMITIENQKRLERIKLHQLSSNQLFK